MVSAHRGKQTKTVSLVNCPVLREIETFEWRKKPPEMLIPGAKRHAEVRHATLEFDQSHVFQTWQSGSVEQERGHSVQCWFRKDIFPEVGDAPWACPCQMFHLLTDAGRGMLRFPRRKEVSVLGPEVLQTSLPPKLPTGPVCRSGDCRENHTLGACRTHDRAGNLELLD
jgi:hypothetical protein